jgi:DNA-binding response OmpR family regulator
MTKIMLIEDDPTMLSLLGTLLEFEGYEPIKLKKFDKILPEIEENKPDLVLMDVHLAQVDGIELLTEIRNQDELQGLKIIMSSGMDVSDECKEKGADAFILKPYMPEELINRIKELIDLH